MWHTASAGMDTPSVVLARLNSTCVRCDEIRNFVRKLQMLTECPVCFDSLDVQHTLCQNGHGVCSTCRYGITVCPICAKAFVLQTSTLVNQLLECLPKLCPFTERGCPIIMFQQDHEWFCQFRPTACKMKECEWKGCVKDLVDHLEKEHNKEYLSGLTTESVPHTILENFSVNTRTSYPIMFKGNLFWYRPTCVTYDGFPYKKNMEITHEVRLLQTKKPEYRYLFVISFKIGEVQFTSTSEAFTGEQLRSSGILLGDLPEVCEGLLCKLYIQILERPI
ncbi:E3 ubiquitin-protein ligase SINA-like 11 isoform X1 [Homalodisca vitripennis]|uniref:E3 ubiquitin-protein ligase SINA-like 11 isoform X1 n=1 Tax=Homalodisca vitripennis TaxID=197043 RepID=UPI001EECE1ED|nr:E3 ubiquitin-protein ligase SINA-like 11 isoform X1 [Homalodisca vitripennis]